MLRQVVREAGAYREQAKICFRQQILQRDTWLDVLGRFLHLQINDKADPMSDKKIRTQTMLFPRFHQWEAVSKLVDGACESLRTVPVGSPMADAVQGVSQKLQFHFHDQSDRLIVALKQAERSPLDPRLCRDGGPGAALTATAVAVAGARQRGSHLEPHGVAVAASCDGQVSHVS